MGGGKWGFLPALPRWGRPGVGGDEGDILGCQHPGAAREVLQEPGGTAARDLPSLPVPPLPLPFSRQEEAVTAKRKESRFAASPLNCEISNCPKGRRLGRGEDTLQGSHSEDRRSTTLCSQQRISPAEHPLPCWDAAIHLPSGRRKTTHLSIRKNFFTLWVAEHWRRLPRVGLESPSLDSSQTHLDMFLHDVLWMALPWQGVRPGHFHDAVIPCN